MKMKLLPLAAVLSVAAFSPAQAEDIPSEGTNAYAVDYRGLVVRDNYGGCVRSIDWSKETAIAKCEGWEEPKPEPKPAPVIAPAPAPKPAPAPVVEKVKEDAPAAFRGFFENDSAELKPEAKEELDVYADYMSRHPETNIKVTGHTDSAGTAAYNQGLSERRAAAVKTYLESKGIDGSRIETVGMGESAPVATNKTKAGRAENRRVEIEVVK
ncbi:OmpA family protein [Thiomicrorhabdus sp. zzn3]|uniref:OmpA family protein n=1 Tax=Thiomicrorhabdus sp. zzn3 TaxID=3039775 RepID=UPI0024364A6B|nr:OmpA family protein [Thiomicrorhabdus sp. zzn3]MDG6777132.1 OmpA family protein [Thiomicrorhabdus sp. zzn3]